MAQTPTERLAANIRAELARQRKSGRSAAHDLGWPASSLARRLAGTTPFDVDELHQVADYLGLPVAALLGTDTAGAA